MKNLTLKVSLLSLFFFSSVASATTEGIPDNYLIQGHSRPCCSFVSGIVSSSIGVFAITSPDKIDFHHFGGKARKEHTGIAYGCKTGFIDTAHMRDNIDWTGHLIKVLPELIGTEKEYPVRKEHVSRTLFMKRVDQSVLNEMTPEDYALLAQRISYDLSVWHEILTGMGISSFDPTGTFTDEMSTFSVEDDFSNLLGTYIGAAAALSPLPFDEAVPEIIQEKFREYEVVSSPMAKAAHQSVYKKWWKRGTLQIPNLKQVNKRHMTPYAEGVSTFRVPDPTVAGCAPLEGTAASLPVPTWSTKGRYLPDFYEIRIPVSKKIGKFVAPYLVSGPQFITQKDFPILISVLHEKYLGLFGEGFDRE